MTAPSRTAALLLTVAACAMSCAGCGLPRRWSPRPDHDLPTGFSGTYRLGLVLDGEVPAGPTDREAIARLASGPVSFDAGPFGEPLPLDGPLLPGSLLPRPAPTTSPLPADGPGAVPPGADVARPLFPEMKAVPRPLGAPGSISPEAKNRRQADGPVAMMTGRTNDRLTDGLARPSSLSTTTPVRR